MKLFAFLAVAAASVAAWRLWGQGKAASSTEPFTPGPKPADAHIHEAAAAVMKQAFESKGLDSNNSFAFVYSLGVAKYETSYGKGWKGAGVGSNNWGAVHALPGQPSFPWKDEHADGTSYEQAFRTYPTPVEGAADVAKRVVVNSGVGRVSESDNPTVWRASLAMRRNMYYGSWCKKTVALFGSSAAKTSANKNPKTEGERACEKEAVSLHVWRMMLETKTIAASLGLPPLKEGTYEDAIAWYEKGLAA